MVDEVFALSPISARAAQPNEADYEAIRDAFMETARGRWFLGEYAKRNRNADTSMVLDAVARIEHALASQRLQQQELDQADTRALPEALAAIRAAVEDAALAAASAVDRLALEENLTPVRKGTRIIKEISWRWREIGADSRICDLIDSQVVSIEAACDQLANADPMAALLAAFDIIKTRLNELDERQASTSAPANETAASAPSTAAPAPSAEAPVSAHDLAAESPHAPEPDLQPVLASQSQLVAAVTAIEDIETSAASGSVMVAEVTTSNGPDVEVPALAAQVSPAVPVEMIAEPSVAEALVEIEQQATGDAEDAAAAEAQDEAILELVAAEMGAPDPIDDEDFSRVRTLGFDIEEPASVDDDIVASFSEPLSEPEPAVAPAEAPVVKAAPTPIAPPVAVAPPMAPPPAPSEPLPAPLPESIAAETLAAVAAAMAVTPQPPPAPQFAEPTPSPVATAPATSATAYTMPKPAYEPSLGSTLLSNGLLQRPQTPATDPLAPIRRMTQPEKIAFFS
ncbi:conserved hypothetical protein [Bradyrhizobium sp. ORS 278]|uniref:hypothetical protein n=1 Tax=Bradyrhizobium sp. (strain ORS 278) TaxID=114615 RepID=UPI0001508395|nr:hypothetical protein [Bradyrhizobium sp. ORS 278]CAL78784.1 conserved hypothetical protein [Bradyrhizobium sp. ORS 278]